jgi:DNA-directed RNA polymerase subunit RPC12/RpoP
MDHEAIIVLSCWHCKARLGLKEEYAHLRGRCPECGVRIEAPRPRPELATPPSLADEPGDLVPIEEEWPEAPRLLDEDNREQYGLASDVNAPPSHPAPETGFIPADAVPDPYAMNPADLAAPPPSAPPAILYQLSQAELNPIRASKPPRRILSLATITFPFWATNRRVWLTSTFGLTGMTLLALTAKFLDDLPERVGAFIVLPLGGLMILGLLTLSYISGSFLLALAELAAGNDDVRWSEESPFERFVKLYYLVWLVALATLPVLVIDWAIKEIVDVRPVYSQVARAAGTLFFFMVFLFSSLTAHVMWSIVDRRILAFLLRRPGETFLVVLLPAVATVPGVELARRAVFELNTVMLPVVGAYWSTWWLMYAHLLGRYGRILSASLPPPSEPARPVELPIDNDFDRLQRVAKRRPDDA